MKYLGFLLIINIIFSLPNDPFVKALSAMKAGLYKDALTHLGEAQNMDQNNPEIYRLKALLHETLDQKEDAIDAWENCFLYSNDRLIKKEAKVHIQNLNQENE
ncbi:MAG: hypothetical protein CMG74_02010 [Candidatus Marinimicrobia bacterium]|nr:hypothetical protein [Candidatus Neomarinimicrobiota bacterium]|tara:strand:+ start:1817 stop:2125 length:309 start_codon:yes stop_codon:yes gene_type:complete